jgi:hypothetical protein
MKSTSEYLDEAKKELNIESDYALAKALGIERTTISNYRAKRSRMDDYTCVQIAYVLRIDPMEVIAAANFEREKDEGRKAFWENFSQHRMVAGVALALLCGSTLWGGFAENFSADGVFLVGSTISTVGEKFILIQQHIYYAQCR